MPSVIQFLCDPCYGAGEPEPGESYTVSVQGPPVSIILCDRHADELLQPLGRVIEEFGVRESSAPASTPPRASLPKGMTPLQALDLIEAGRCIFSSAHGPFAGRNGGVGHLRNVHGLSMKQLGLGGSGVTRDAARVRLGTQNVPSRVDDATPSESSSVSAVLSPGEPGPLGATPPPEPYECPECHRTFTRPQGMGRHRLSVHGVPGTARLPKDHHGAAQPELSARAV